MVLPLQTWQYSEPKRLWPLLGGLSVLAHVGVLGLSLPYLLELMEPVGDRVSTSTTPVELIVISGSAQSTASPAKPLTSVEEPLAPSETAPSETAVTPVKAAADSPRPSAISTSQGRSIPSSGGIGSSTAIPSQALPTSTPDGTASSRPTPVQVPVDPQPNLQLPVQNSRQGPDPITETPSQTPVTPDLQVEDSQSRESQSRDSQSGTDSAQSGASAVGDEGAGNAVGRNEVGEGESEELPVQDDTEPTEPVEPTEPTEPTEPAEPPVIEGEQLPTPDAPSGEDMPQVAALQIIGTKIDAVQDIKDEPPRLVDRVGAISLQPDSPGCGQVDFAQGALTYRLTINTDNTLRIATPLSSPESPSVQAVACLIESAGFSFEAARSEGSPVVDDSLLMTVKVIESQL